MTKSILFATAAALSLVATPVLAGGWGGSYTSNCQSPSFYNGHNNQSSGGLVNVSPTVNLGGLANGVLAGAAIGSGNNILSGNSTGIGVLGAGTAGLLNNIVGNIRKR
jgi:hypothetical protein